MVVVWWSAAGLIHHSFLDPGETITAERYCHDIDEMHRKLQLMSPGLVNRKGPILLNDNVLAYVAQTTLKKLNELGYGTVPHQAYSSDFASTDYHFFEHLDNFLDTEKRFDNRHDVESTFLEFIASRSPEFCATRISKLVNSRQKCVDNNGSYFD
uniref:Histone-lysine N-methyltransferase SETMAR n=1 Tax=Haemonchus contortus TaxID=6289 RepID=A0A7I4YXC5_HAECO